MPVCMLQSNGLSLNLSAISAQGILEMKTFLIFIYFKFKYIHFLSEASIISKVTGGWHVTFSYLKYVTRVSFANSHFHNTSFQQTMNLHTNVLTYLHIILKQLGAACWSLSYLINDKQLFQSALFGHLVGWLC